MDPKTFKTKSKTISFVLRHKPDTIGIQLDDHGWVAVDVLLAGLNQHGHTFDLATLQKVVEQNDKQRFEFSECGQHIRARQGHSVAVDLNYEPATPPDRLYHGTATKHLTAIQAQGLKKQKRHHVHMGTDIQTMLAVAMRQGKPVLLAIDAQAMHADGHTFFVTANGVWLTDSVPPKYLQIETETIGQADDV